LLTDTLPFRQGKKQGHQLSFFQEQHPGRRDFPHHFLLRRKILFYYNTIIFNIFNIYSGDTLNFFRFFFTIPLLTAIFK